jgi:hypothetical protein|tara:strand:+ start:198 stop:977 length:780 start_codon:yes stop_codon:yes gene_type:complete
MEETPMFKIPTIDFSSKSLLMLAQFGFFASFAAFGLQDPQETIDYVWPVMMATVALSLFLSVPNARMGSTIGVPIVMVVVGLAMGENEMMFWAVFMLLIVGAIAYMPALAMGDEDLGLDDQTRVMRLGILYTIFAIFMLVMMSSLMDAAMDGELIEEDNDGNRIAEYTLDSSQKTVAQIGLGMGALGILVFVMTAVMGMELGPARPWHAGVLMSGAVCFDGMLWFMVESAQNTAIPDILWTLAICGIFTLVPCVAYEGE